jgi:GAF domain-containing protein
MDGENETGAGPRRPAAAVVVRQTAAAGRRSLYNPIDMTSSDHRLPLWVICSLIGAFAIVQLWALALTGGLPSNPIILAQLIAGWIVMLVLGFFAANRIGGLARRLTQREDAHLASLGEIEQLLMQNSVLQVIARSADVLLAFQSLASRIVRLVPCDRVGLALLSQNGQEFQTYTARVNQDERRHRPRPEMVFKTDRTVIGRVARSRQAVIIDDARESASDNLDMNVLHSAGFASALVLPLVSKGRAVGTLNVVSRRARAFQPAHIEILEPIAEIFAVAYVAQQLQVGLSQYRTMEAMSELTLSIASEINGALQTIAGHCELIERGYPDPSLQRDVATITRQAQRITALLEKMRAVANERMKEVADSVPEGSIPSSPEAYADRE